MDQFVALAVAFIALGGVVWTGIKQERIAGRQKEAADEGIRLQRQVLDEQKRQNEITERRYLAERHANPTTRRADLRRELGEWYIDLEAALARILRTIVIKFATEPMDSDHRKEWQATFDHLRRVKEGRNHDLLGARVDMEDGFGGLYMDLVNFEIHLENWLDIEDGDEKRQFLHNTINPSMNAVLHEMRRLDQVLARESAV